MMRGKLAQVALRTSLVYALAAALWILVSGVVLTALVPSPDLRDKLEIYKGWAFVAVTAILLFVTLRSQLRRWETEAAARQQAESALRDSQSRLQLALESGHAGTWGWDIVGGQTWWDEAAAKLFGRSAAEAAGGPEKFVSFVHPDDRARVEEIFKKAVVEGGDCQGEYRIQRPDGTVLWINDRARVERDASGRVWRMTGACVDITERKRAEETHTRLATAVEQCDETIVITDTQGAILYVNPAFERVSGYVGNEVIGLNPRILKSGKHDVDFYRKMWDLLAEGKVWAGRITNKKKSGVLYEEEMTISPVRDSAGKIVNYVAVKRDVTQERVLETQLRQAQKMEAIGQLSSGVAHDFNNILTVIHGNATLMLLPDLDPAEKGVCAQQILQAAERAGALTRQLLLFSRKQVMQPIRVDLNKTVVDMSKMLKRLLGEDVEFHSELEPDLPAILADVGMIEQVLLNLAVNARDAMPSGGRLTIATSAQTPGAELLRGNPEAKPGRQVCLSVSETGCGISPEILPRVFEAFYTTKEAGKGTGLGLTIVQGIVRQHQGWIDIESVLGKGAAFRIYLPILAGERPSAKPPPPAPSLSTGKETILVVEDETSLRLLVSRVLERCGYTVLQATSGAAALELWKEQGDRVQLLLTDLVMPSGISGFELARKLQAEKPQLHVIFTSGYSAKAGQGPKLIEGKNFLQKPYSSLKLTQLIRDCLDRKANTS